MPPEGLGSTPQAKRLPLRSAVEPAAGVRKHGERREAVRAASASGGAGLAARADHRDRQGPGTLGRLHGRTRWLPATGGRYRHGSGRHRDGSRSLAPGRSDRPSAQRNRNTSRILRIATLALAIPPSFEGRIAGHEDHPGVNPVSAPDSGPIRTPIPEQSGHRFRRHPELSGFHRNHCPESIGIAVRIRPDSLSGFNRCRHAALLVRFRRRYAHHQCGRRGLQALYSWPD